MRDSDVLVMAAEALDERARAGPLDRACIAELMARLIASQQETRSPSTVGTPPPGSIPERGGTPAGEDPSLSAGNPLQSDLSVDQWRLARQDVVLARVAGRRGSEAVAQPAGRVDGR